MYRQFLADNRTMEDLFACAPYYRILGLTASPGRTIAPEDDRPGATTVVSQARRFSTAPTSVRPSRIQLSWKAFSASLAEPSIR